MLVKFKKDFKGKEDSYNHNDRENLEKYDVAGNTIAWNYYDGKKGYDEAISDMERWIANNEDKVAESKSLIKQYNKNLKKLKDSRESCLAYLKSKGMKTQEDCENKITDYVHLMDECRNNVDKAKDMREQFYQEAVAYNEANKKNLLSVDELVKQNVDGIMSDLHTMDDEWKAKIKAENDRRFGRDKVNKSWCYFDRDGNLYIKKSALLKYSRM